MDNDKSLTNKKPIYKKWWFWPIALVVVVALAQSGAPKEPASPQPSPEIVAENTDPQPPAKVEPVINKSLAEERKKFDKELGNNTEAAKLAAQLIANAQKTGIGNIGVNLTLGAPEKAETQYANGGSETEYQRSVTSALMAVVVPSSLWSSLNDESRKDFVSTFVVVLHGRYPNVKYPAVRVGNTLRVVAEGSWSNPKNEPRIELK